MEKEEIELASDKSASDIEITVEELLDFGIDVDQVIQRRCYGLITQSPPFNVTEAIPIRPKERSSS